MAKKKATKKAADKPSNKKAVVARLKRGIAELEKHVGKEGVLRAKEMWDNDETEVLLPIVALADKYQRLWKNETAAEREQVTQERARVLPPPRCK